VHQTHLTVKWKHWKWLDYYISLPKKCSLIDINTSKNVTSKVSLSLNVWNSTILTQKMTEYHNVNTSLQMWKIDKPHVQKNETILFFYSNFAKGWPIITRRPASTDRTACRQFQATGQPVSRMQVSDAMTSRLPRYEAKCVQCRCFQCGSVPLCSDIKGIELPPANILIPLERQLIALQLCRCQRQSCSAINCLSSGINILAGGRPLAWNHGPK